MTTKLARLYLVNDILQNTTSKQSNLMSLKRGYVYTHTRAHTHTCTHTCSFCLPFLPSFESRLQTIFEHFHKVHQSMESKSRAEAFRVRACTHTHTHTHTHAHMLPPPLPSPQRRSMLVLRALQEQSVFHWDFMTKMRTTFIGHSREEMEKKKAFVSSYVATQTEILWSPFLLSGSPRCSGGCLACPCVTAS